MSTSAGNGKKRKGGKGNREGMETGNEMNEKGGEGKKRTSCHYRDAYPSSRHFLSLTQPRIVVLWTVYSSSFVRRPTTASTHPVFLHVTARTSGMPSIDKKPARRIHLVRPQYVVGQETHPERDTGNSTSLGGDEDTKTHAGPSLARAGSWRTRYSRRTMWASALWYGECIRLAGHRWESDEREYHTEVAGKRQW
jgi:hypothetical protein